MHFPLSTLGKPNMGLKFSWRFNLSLAHPTPMISDNTLIHTFNERKGTAGHQTQLNSLVHAEELPNCGTGGPRSRCFVGNRALLWPPLCLLQLVDSDLAAQLSAQLRGRQSNRTMRTKHHAIARQLATHVLVVWPDPSTYKALSGLQSGLATPRLRI